MNITTSIAKEIGGEIESIINNNPAIQFYANSNLNCYQWRDTRFTESYDLWLNKSTKNRAELISIFKDHLISNNQITNG